MDTTTGRVIASAFSWLLLLCNAVALVIGVAVFQWTTAQASATGEQWGLVALPLYAVPAILIQFVMLAATLAVLCANTTAPRWSRWLSLVMILGGIVLLGAAVVQTFGYSAAYSARHEKAYKDKAAIYTTGLRDAVIAGDVKRADAILAADPAGLFDTDYEGNTALMLAVQRRDEPMVELLLRWGADPDKGHYSDTHPLHLAADLNAVDIIRRLLDKGARINDEDDAGRTALARAKIAGSAAAEALLKSRGGKDTDDTMRAIRAVEAGNIPEVKRFLDAGLDVGVAAPNGHCLLDFAAEKGDVPMAEFLISRGASVHRTDAYGRTPLHWASDDGKANTAAFLLDKGADINALDHERMTPLHYAMDKAQFHEAEALATVKTLVTRGADLKIQNKSGQTPVEWADQYGTPDIKAFLAPHKSK